MFSRTGHASGRFSGLSLLTLSGVLASSALVVLAAPAQATPLAHQALPDQLAVPAVVGEPSLSDPARPARGPRAVEADGEVPSLRTETSRTYRLENGRLQVQIANRPVNHRDATGIWQKNDTTLADDGSGGGHNRAGAYRLSLPKEIGSRPVTVAVGDDSVGFSLTGGRGTLTRQASTGTYADALPGVDLEYQAQHEGVKETLILKSATAPTS